VLFAVELYHLRHGKLPQSLRDLESLDLPAVTLSIMDPLTEKPYIYRIQDGDYFLYSVGTDLTDHGGAEPIYGTQKPWDVVFHAPSKQ